MKRFGWIVFSLFVGATLWGQAAPSAVPAPTQNQAAPNAAPTPTQNQAAVMSELQNRPMPTGWNSGRMQRSLRLMADLKEMHTKLDEMKANAAKVKDPAVKQQLQMENELWAMMLAQLQTLMGTAPQAAGASGRYAPAGQRYLQQRPMSRPDGASPAAPEAPKPAGPSDHP
jgi:hypothetical protein